MGAGARALLCPRLGFVVHGAARDTRSGRVAALGRLAGGDGGEGHVRLYGAELFPPAPRGGPGGVSAVCESAGAQEIRHVRNAECGVRSGSGRSSRGTTLTLDIPHSAHRTPHLITEVRSPSRLAPTRPPPPEPLR